MKSIKCIKRDILFIVMIGIMLLLFCLGGHSTNAESYALTDNEMGIEDYFGYGCGETSQDIVNASYYKGSYDIESEAGFGCNDSSCGDGRENGYSSTFLNKGCRNWQVMPLYTPFYNYYIDESSLTGLSQSQQDLFKENVNRAVELWNSTFMHDQTEPLVWLREEKPEGLFVSGANTCPIEYCSELSGLKGKFYPIPLAYKIEIKSPTGYDTMVHELGHLLGLQDLDMNSTSVHNALMGYGSMRSGLTYHDIQGLAVANGKHVVHDFSRYAYQDGKYKHVCFYCDIVDIENSPNKNSVELELASTCSHNYVQFISAGSIHWLKCKFCYKVIKTEWKSNFYPNDGKLEYQDCEYGYFVKKPLTTDLDFTIPALFNGKRVVGIADNAFASILSLQSVDMPNSIEWIGEAAFAGCNNLLSVSLSNSIKEISDRLFLECTSLKKVNLPLNIKSIGKEAFKNCFILSAVDIPSSVTSIGEEAFYCCRDLQSIVIPFGVTEIMESTFEACTNIVNISLPDSLTKIGDNAFKYAAIANITIPNNVTYIGKYAFGFSGLESINIPDSVTYLGDCAFIFCPLLENVTMSKNITILNKGLFMSCERLSSINLHDGLIEIGEQAFRFCGLKKLELPYSLVIIGRGAFMNCESLEAIDIGYGTKTICEEAFLGCSALLSVSIPNSVSTIMESAFAYCDALTDVFINTRISYIADRLFYNCSSLRSVGIFNNITSIGDYAFYGSGLTDLVISSNVSNIGDNAFEKSSIKEISVSPNNEYFAVHDGVLYNKDKTTIVYVPNKLSGETAVHRSVTAISSNNFANRDLLKSITIPHDVIRIDEDAFSGCDCLTIYVEEYLSAASGWNSAWNSYNRPVIWGCNLDGNGYVSYVYKTSNTISNPEAHGGINAPYLDGFEFKGWATTQNGLPAFTSATIVNAPNNTTLYALWSDLFASSLRFTLITSSNSYEVGVKNGITVSGDIVLPSTYRGLKVTRIADSGFFDNAYVNANARTKDITSITLPDSIVEIGNNAFKNCKGLIKFNVPISSSLATINDMAFSGCSKLTEFNLPCSVKSIGKLSFYNCSSMISFTYSDDCKLATIGDNAFDACSMLTDAYLPNSIKKMGTYVFDGCKSLTSVAFPSTITSIPDGMFSGCNALQIIEIPSTVISIGQNAFSYCDIKSIIIPASVTSIGDYAFLGCALNSIYVNPKNNVFSSGGSCLIRKSNNELILGSSKSIIPSVVKSISAYAFYGCNITAIRIPNSVTEIGNSAFGFCTSLKKILFSCNSELVKIGEGAFSFTAITNIIIPPLVDYIGSGAFSSCDQLSEALFYNTNGWICNYSNTATGGKNVSSDDLANMSAAARYLNDVYCYYVWRR